MRISIEKITSGSYSRNAVQAWWNLLDCTKCKKWIWPVMLSPCQRWTFENCFTCGLCDICGLCAEIRTTKICPCTFVTDCLLNVKTEQLKSGSGIRIICLWVILCNDMWPHFQRIHTSSCICGETLHLCFQLLLCGCQDKLRKITQWNCSTWKL